MLALRFSYQSELVCQIHWVDPTVDVKNEVHLEGFRFAVEARDPVEPFALWINVLHVKDVLK